MFERLLQIIVFVVQELHQNKSLNDIQVNNLQNLGYTDVEISTAISWLVDKTGFDTSTARNSKSFRILNQSERDMFSHDSLSDLMQYNALGLVSNEQIDFILDRALMSGISYIDRTTLTYIIMAFIFQIAPDSRIGSRVMLTGNDTIN